MGLLSVGGGGEGRGEVGGEVGGVTMTTTGSGVKGRQLGSGESAIDAPASTGAHMRIGGGSSMCARRNTALISRHCCNSTFRRGRFFRGIVMVITRGLEVNNLPQRTSEAQSQSGLVLDARGTRTPRQVFRPGQVRVLRYSSR
mmetsp:Transcript_19915/g.36250  ORF Transcript_19915/g.36250 Transcript_19915/m.36250 type:complete len:143 (+) Transcript_19915:883-1311(+)